MGQRLTVLAYLDSCLHIYSVERDPTWARTVDRLLGTADLNIATSALVLMECLVKPFRMFDRRLEQRYRILLATYHAFPLTTEVFELAARLRADTPGLKTPDAIHLACAMHYRCDEFWTNDDRGLTGALAGRLVVRTLSRGANPAP